jgi:ABC-2 type transport system permease protein
VNVLTDSWIVFRRQTAVLLQNPVWLIAGTLQPLFFVLLFAPLLPKVLGVASTGEAYSVFVPGLLVLVATISGLFAGLGLIGDARAGILERCRVTPVSRLALLLGRCGRDVVMILIQATVIVLVAVAFGMRVGIGELALAYLLLTGVAVMLSALSYGIAVAITAEEAMSSMLQTVLQPLELLSGVMLPLALAPAWMLAIAWWNPLSHVVAAERSLFAGAVGDPVVWQATLLVGGLAVVALTWARRAFVRTAR